MTTLLFVVLLLQDLHRIGAAGPVSLLILLAGAHRFYVRDAIHGQDPIQVIDFVLQQLGQIALFIRVNFMLLTAQILIPHGDFTVPLDLHKNGKKTQTRIPHHYFFFAPFGDHRIHDWPGLLARQPQKNNSHVRANLRRRNPTPVSCCFSPISKSVREILDQRANLRRSGIVNFLRHLAQSRVSQLQNSPYRHIRLSLCVSTLVLLRFFAFFSLFPLLCVLCALRVEVFYGLSHLPDSPARKTASITAMFAIASSSGTGTSLPSRIACENASPCTVY